MTSFLKVRYVRVFFSLLVSFSLLVFPHTSCMHLPARWYSEVSIPPHCHSPDEVGDCTENSSRQSKGGLLRINSLPRSGTCLKAALSVSRFPILFYSLPKSLILGVHMQTLGRALPYPLGWGVGNEAQGLGKCSDTGVQPQPFLTWNISASQSWWYTQLFAILNNRALLPTLGGMHAPHWVTSKSHWCFKDQKKAISSGAVPHLHWRPLPPWHALAIITL